LYSKVKGKVVVVLT